MPSNARVLGAHVAHAIGAKAGDAIFTKASDATTAKATHVTSTKAAHTATKATHVAPAAHATTVSATTAATAAAGLRARGKKAAGEQCGSQNHRYSSSHDILHLRWADFSAAGSGQTLACFSKVEPTSRWTGDGISSLSSLLNSLSIVPRADGFEMFTHSYRISSGLSPVDKSCARAIKMHADRDDKFAGKSFTDKSDAIVIDSSDSRSGRAPHPQIGSRARAHDGVIP
jgi:hypothetical protein